MFPIRGSVGFHRVAPIRPVRAIDEPWQDGDHVGSDDDKEELGGVPALVWRGPASRSPRRQARTPVEAAVRETRRQLQRRRAQQSQVNVGPAPEAPLSSLGRFQSGEAWEATLLTRAPRR